MTSAEKQLQIINLSLVNLGQDVITQAQLDANAHPAAVAANLWWQPCRDEALGANNWSFATVTETLSALDITDDKWDYVYSYPTMTVSSVWYVYNSETADTKDGQEFTVRYIPTLGVSAIFSGLESAYAEYTYQVTNPNQWSPQFINAFTYRLAAAMATMITGAEQKGILAAQTYNNFISEAKRLSFAEKPKKPDEISKYVDARG